MSKCFECGATIKIPKDCEKGEIIDCPVCYTGYEIIKKHGKLDIMTLDLDGEDWGE